jgi:transcriptional regulator with PAS, ATPase and Fis domain
VTAEGGFSVNAKIALVGYKDFVDYTRSIMKTVKRDVSIDFYVYSPDRTVELLHQLEEYGTDMIITGRTPKTLMEDKTDIPIISFQITSIDILSAIKKSISLSKHIAIAFGHFEDLEYDYSILQDLLDIQLHFITYKMEDELKEKIEQFSKTKGVVIGTSIASRFAKEFGMESIIIYSLENSILGSIDRALEIIHFKREEEQKNKRFKAIINSVTDGIIATNDQNEITIINESAWNLLQIQKGTVLGKDISEMIPDHSMWETESYDDPSQDKMIKVGYSTLNTTRTSITVKGIKSGNVYTFQDITKIKIIEQKYRLENEAKGLIAKNHFEDMVFSSDVMIKMVQRAKKFAQTDSTILITGETGTGKEILAQSIHNFSNRKFSPFVAINCAAIPETLLESELFGYEDGAFTGAAKKGKKGLFELAHNGTVFLDEINSISTHFQARLLRVLQEREIVRIGGTKVIPIDIRIIAATNQDLRNLIVTGHFRADLFYRLNLLKITLPPLRNRIDDIIPIAKHLIYDRNVELYHYIASFCEDLFQQLFTYNFPGNIRELINILERFIILCDTDKKHKMEYYKEVLSECMDDHSEDVNVNNKVEFELKDDYRQSLIEAERSLLKRYLQMEKDDKSFISKKMGISRTTLYRKLKDLNLNASL